MRPEEVAGAGGGGREGGGEEAAGAGSAAAAAGAQADHRLVSRHGCGFRIRAAKRDSSIEEREIGERRRRIAEKSELFSSSLGLGSVCDLSPSGGAVTGGGGVLSREH